MVIAKGLASQLAHPRGMRGLLLGKAMDLANHRLMLSAIGRLAPAPGETILDAGCGTGIALERAGAIAPCRLAGLDPSQQMLRMARKRLGAGADLRAGRIEDRPFDRMTFDGILALNVLYFAGEDGAMPRALFDMLRPGGRLVAYVTARETMERWNFAKAGFHRLYDERQLAGLLIGGGFDPDRVNVQREAVGGGATGLFAFATR